MVKGGHPMIGASKILTVSYGTFSCTLEGFDDPFNTMRAIAEYFRDLAAEDRYFGAEPPTPDAAMLLKIAEREVQRRVEAKINENGVVLRTGEAMQSPAFMPTTLPSAPMPVASRPVQTAPETIPQQTPIATPMPDGVAAKLLRIRAAVATAELADTRADTRAEAAPSPIAPAPTAPILADYSEDQHADEIGTASTLTATFVPDAFAATGDDVYVWDQPISSGPAAEYDEDLSAAVSTDLATDVPEEQPSFTDEPALGEAAVLATIAGADLAPAQIDHPEDAWLSTLSKAEVAPVLAADDTVLVALNSSIAPDFAISEPATTAAEDVTEDYTISDEDLSDLRALDSDEVVPPTVPEPDALDDFTYDVDNSEAFDNAVADLSEADEADATQSYDEADVEDEPALNEYTAAVDPMIEEIDNAYDEPNDGADLAATSGPSAKALRARARVIKVRRDDVDVAPAAAPDSTAANVSALLAADAEADLRRELRALQQQSVADIATKPVDTKNETGPDEEAGPEDDARQRLDTAGEAAVSRLIEQTNEAMAVPENRRRLSAIAHLKAAVAATVADRFAKGGTAPKEVEAKRLHPYREDLARVVRPQPPTDAADAPATPRPAPLVLVSAQRIDRPRAAPTEGGPTLSAVPNAPVRPRRVTSAALAAEPTPETDDEEESETSNVFSDSRGFAEFSERLGANSLAEILEAAAAYSVCIEGRPYFSRPQLMSQIGALSADSEFSREDGLRTFGAMLREGRIQKIKRGQFVLTEGSRYLAEARALAG